MLELKTVTNRWPDFDSLDITLDTGHPVSYEQLCGVCEEYWSEWSAKHQQV
jgi:hypothetical protein